MHLAKRSLSRWRRPAAVCLVVLLALPGARLLAARAGAGVVAVQLKRAGSGPPAKTVGGVRIVDGSTGEVLAATSVGARSKAKLGAPAGVEFAVASVARPKGLREAVSDIFRFDGDGVLKLKIALDQTQGAPRVRGTALRSHALAGGPLAASGSPVATLGPVTIDVGGTRVPIGGPLFTPLFNDTSDFMRWVDTSEALQRARQRELDLQDAGASDPSTRIVDQPLAPDLRIEGELASDGRTVTGELRIVDPATGEVLDRIAVDTQGRDWPDLMAELARELATRLRNRRVTTTTSTTSTTTTTASSTSSTTATAPSTTTSTSSSATTTTVPAGGTCTSIIPASYCQCAGGDHLTCTSDALCETYGEGQCVDHVGHTVVTFRLAGSGARLGALQIDGGDDGLADFPGGVDVRRDCGSTEDNPVPVPAADTVCPTFYHPGTTVTITARRELPPSPSGDLFCASTFTGFSGDCLPAWVTATRTRAAAASSREPRRPRSWRPTTPRAPAASPPPRPDASPAATLASCVAHRILLPTRTEGRPCDFVSDCSCWLPCSEPCSWYERLPRGRRSQRPPHNPERR